METRTFEFRDATSDKFWSISLEGVSYTVRFGRRGTAGQEQTKEFPSNDAARKSYDKLIAEKVKKGYLETGSGSATPPAHTPTPVVPRKPSSPPPPSPAKTAPVETGEVIAPPPVAPKPTKKAADRPPGPALHIAPEDWLFATWRERTIRVRPAPKPFSLEDSMRRFDRAFDVRTYLINWDHAQMEPAMSPEEGRFWLGAMQAVHLNGGGFTSGVDKVREAMARLDVEKTPPLEDTIRDFAGFGSAAVLLPLSALHSWVEVVRFVRTVAKTDSRRNHYLHFGQADSVFRNVVLPYLTAAELEALREAVASQLDITAQWTGRSLAENLATLVGLGPLLQEWGQRSPLTPAAVLGMHSEAVVVEEMRKLARLNPFSTKCLRGWLAHTETRELDWLTTPILGAWSKDDKRSLTKELARLVTAPALARPMLRIFEEGQISEAKAWFDANPEIALEGLEAHAWGREKLGQAAQSMIASLHRKLGLATVESATPVAGELPEGLERAMAAIRSPKLKPPKWVSAADLPPIQMESGRLPDADVNLVLAVLATSTPRPPHPITLALKCYARPESLDTFADGLFEEWRRSGMTGKDKWALLAMGALGSDRCALRLAPLVREWPGESKHQAAVWGLECLRLIGTDTSLMQISLIAQKAKFAALKKNAQETMEAIAEDRGLTRDELEDRIVPDCGLDAQGSRLFDFGPRQFRLRIGPELKPVVVDGEGNRKDDLPKPGAKDDPVKAPEAVSDWKLLKKQVADVVKVQVARLEQGLVTQRRWPAADFEGLILTHPILSQLARRLLWGAYDGKSLRQSFRVAEDGTLANQQDETLALPADARIGIVHPAQLDETLRGGWGEVFADYEIVQPFPQLVRTVRRLTEAELKGNEITRHTEVSLEPVVFAGILKRLGYMTGPVGDGGSYSDHVKWFLSAGLTAVMQNSGMSIGYYDTDPVHIERVYFVREQYSRGDWFGSNPHKVRLAEVSQEVISEVLGDLNVLALRAGEKK